jgi:hypothetical protein
MLEIINSIARNVAKALEIHCPFAEEKNAQGPENEK